MPPLPSGHMAPDRPPRHAAEADSSGRHRRPESLADSAHLRPAVVAPPARRRVPADFSAADVDILEARRAARRLQSPPPPASPRRHAAPARGRRSAPPRGKHVRSADPLAITVRPLNDGLRAAGAWARDTGGRPPATGSHRAPGTLPIESWLLVGRTRQQALLASLVAIGLTLVMIPAQRDDDGSSVTAAGQASAAAQQSRAAAKKPGAIAKPPKRTTAGSPEEVPGKPAEHAASPAPGATPAPPPAEEEAEAELTPVPPGDGPAKSLTTTGTETVALTFDDGPDPVQTPKILAMLDKYHVKATFCLVGAQVEKYPEIVRQIAAAGHTLCNHTWDHSLTIGRYPAPLIRADLERTNAAIRAAVPDAEIPFFRAPGGNFTDRLVRTAYADDMASLYWDVDPRDWDHTTDPDDASHVDKIVAGVQKVVRPGSIVLSHDFNQPDTILAYEELLPWLSENFALGPPSVPPPPSAAPPSASAPPA